MGLVQMKLKDALRDALTEHELELLVRAYDVVGDIAITIIPPELEARESLIGRAILRLHKNVRVVAKRCGNYGGELRTISLAVIAGENRKETECREHGVRLCLNPEKVYFSVRSSNERKRLASLVQPNEDILVMFSGIGAFPLVIAANSRAGEIVGIEKNQHAHAYAVRNLALNKKITNVTFLEGDVVDVLPTLGAQFDRIVMPLPTAGERFLDGALGALRQNGQLHFYDFQPTGRFDDAVEKIARACAENSRTLVRSQTVVCGHCSPRTYRICVDAQIA
jgi:tRNA (guanine37-N1)-methyltransferase